MSLSSMFSAAAGAAAKLVAGGPSLPFETGPEVTSFQGKSPWRLHSGKKEDKATGKMQDVSLFLFDMKDRAPAELAAARNGMRRMRTIKHPTAVSHPSTASQSGLRGRSKKGFM